MKRQPLFSLIFTLTVLSDQLTKYLASTFVAPMEPVELLPFFSLVNVRNTGAAFGLFASFGNTIFIAVAILAIVLIAFLMVREKEGFLPFTLILSGAVGNLIDRIALGYVRDFLDFHVGSYHWPAFNVADSALTIGIILLLAGSFFPRRTQNASS